MIFKRRERPPFWLRMREVLSPRKGWKRGFAYIGKRVQRLPDTPHRIALGFACGALASFTPFFTLHLFVAAGLAWIVRANVLAGAFGTIVGNPISFAFIAAVSLRTGNWLLGREGGRESIDDLSLSYVYNHPWEFFDSIFTPYLIGGIIPGLVCAAGFYFLLRPTIASFQTRRRERLSNRARDLVSARMKRQPKAAGRGRSGDEQSAQAESKSAEASRPITLGRSTTRSDNASLPSGPVAPNSSKTRLNGAAPHR